MRAGKHRWKLQTIYLDECAHCGMQRENIRHKQSVAFLYRREGKVIRDGRNTPGVPECKEKSDG